MLYLLRTDCLDDPPSSNHNLTMHIIDVWLPVGTGILIPLCLVNLYTLLFCCGNLLEHPSLLLYANLLLMDLCNGAVAIMVRLDDASQSKWHEGASKLYLLSFDAEIVLIFGLAFIRWIWVALKPINVIRNLRTFSYAFVTASWLFGGFAVIYPNITHARKAYYPYFAFFDIGECVVLLGALGLSVSTNIIIRRSKRVIGQHNYRMASRTTLALTANFIVSYVYYLVLNIARIFDIKHKFPPGSCFRVMIDMSIEIGVSWMVLQGVITGIILLNMRQIRFGLKTQALRMWKTKMGNSFGYQRLHDQL